MNFIDRVKERAKQNVKTIILPEYMDRRVVEAACKVRDEGIANIIIIGNEDEVKSSNSDLDFTNIKFIDPKTGKYYREDSKKFKNLTDDVKDRLIPREQDEEDKLKKRIEIWKGVNEELLQKNCMKLNGEEKKKKLCQLIEDAVGYNS